MININNPSKICSCCGKIYTHSHICLGFPKTGYTKGYVDGITSFDIFISEMPAIPPSSGFYNNNHHTFSSLSKTEYERGYKKGRADKNREMALSGGCGNLEYSGG